MSVLALAIGLAALPATKQLQPVEVRSKFFVIAYEDELSGQVMLPIVRDIRSQVPIGFQLKVKPENMVAGTGLRTTQTGDTILEIKLRPMKREQRIEVECKSQLIVDMAERCYVPDIPIPDKLPANAEQWLRPSAYVQSDHAAIRAKADEVKTGNLNETVRATILLWSQIVGAQKGMATELSSVTALTTKGTCTSEANLLAALLRAKGIAARIISVYPTTAGRPYQAHYEVEVFCGDIGWLPAHGGGMSCMAPIVSVVGLANENQGSQRLQGAAGVPFLSLTETAGKLVARGLLSKDYSYCEAKLDLKKKIDPALWQPAKERWARWLEASRSSVVDLPASYQL